MKKHYIYILFISAFLIFPVHSAIAQRGVESGSLRIAVQRPDILQIEISGLLSFKDNVTGGLLLGNLFPGDYWVKVSVPQRSRRGMAAFIFDQNVRVQPGQCVTINIEAGGRVMLGYAAEPNSVMLCAAGRDPHRRDQPTVYPINEADLNKMLLELKRYTFDDDKQKVLDASAMHHFYLSDQLGQIMTVFRSDDYKLQCAKTLIPRVLDPENLYLQASVFTFNSSRENYLNLIRPK